jgi:hypothetical protein
VVACWDYYVLVATRSRRVAAWLSQDDNALAFVAVTLFWGCLYPRVPNVRETEQLEETSI